MARATNPGAPQRVSAHVVPKAPSFSSDDEEEKTTIESGGWEEEASTTVEQGEVAEKVRALATLGQAARSNTSITSTNGSGVNDEPTVDDQRASAALALMPPPSAARLVITQGNDAGRHLEIRPGKTYTIGRGIDNDLVLTDITASRKHFDLRNDNGSWILADRGSGNGTLINSRIQDAPFMLASGDAIEVGNTAFRFEIVTTAISLPGLPREVPAGSARDLRAAELPTLEDPSDSRELPTPAVHAPPVSRELITPAVLREAAAAAAREAQESRDANGERAPEGRIPDDVPSFDGSVDDLELSTVSGKPMKGVDADTEAPTPHVAAGRPKTLPPPAPLPRPRTQSSRPPLAFAATRSQQLAVAQPTQPPIPPVALAAAMAPTISPMHAVPALPQPATTLPLPQMANRPPLAPGLLDSSLGAQLAPPVSSLPATLPGQGPPVPVNRAPRLPFSYPSAPELMAQRSSGIIRAPMNVAAGHPGRDATSTALVQPMSYSGGQAVASPPVMHRKAPLISRRTMLALGLLGLTVLAAIVTMIIRSTAVSGGSAQPAPAVVPRPQPATTPAARPPTVTPIQGAPAASPGGGAGGARPGADKAAPAALPASPAAHPPSADKIAVAPAPSTSAAGPTTAPAASAPAAPTPAAPVHTSSADKIAAATPPAVPPAPAPKVTGAPAPPGPATASAAPPPTPGPAPETAHAAGSDKPPATASAAPPPTPAKSSAAPPPTPGPAPEAAHAAGSDKTRSDTASAKTTRPVKHAEPRKPERKVEVAAAAPKHHSGRSLQDLKSEATGLYRSKNFSGAAAAINSSLSGFSGDDVKDLKAIAAIYSQLGKAYAVGMAYGTKPIEAYQNLQRAIDYDREVGAAYTQELRDKLVAVAPRAATSYMAAKSYEQAFQAVRTAEALGSKSDDLKIVRGYLVDKASELLRAARSELATDPEEAKQKLHQIQAMVERQHTLWQQAAKLLNGP